MAARGGARKGAGRPKTKDTPEGKLRQELAIRALTEGKTPLEVILEAMRVAYEEGGAKAAVPFAKEAAPYMHPRLASVDASLSGELGTYAAQPIPTEERHPMESAAGPAANGHSTS